MHGYALAQGLMAQVDIENGARWQRQGDAQQQEQARFHEQCRSTNGLLHVL
jgi:hypothetical protein